MNKPVESFGKKGHATISFEAFDPKCGWSEHEYVWSTGCGEEFEFTTDGPIENGFHYCPYCGSEIVEE